MSVQILSSPSFHPLLEPTPTTPQHRTYPGLCAVRSGHLFRLSPEEDFISLLPLKSLNPANLTTATRSLYPLACLVCPWKTSLIELPVAQALRAFIVFCTLICTATTSLIDIFPAPIPIVSVRSHIWLGSCYRLLSNPS